MRRAAPTALLVAALVAISIALAGVASTFALAHGGTSELAADLASQIRADYSADPTGTTLAPLDEGLLESARQDEESLREAGDDVVLMPIFWTDEPHPVVVFEDPNGAGALPPGDVEVPGPGPTAGATPGRGETPAPGETPDPGATPTPRPEPGVTPTPSVTPKPDLTPTPTPTPSPTPLELAFYLHNNPTPPVGDTAAQHDLTMNTTLPTGTVLYNYDTDRDAFPGLTIKRGGSGPWEADDTKHQHWRSAALPTDVLIEGNVEVELWSAMKEFKAGRGVVTVYLYDYGGSYTLIGVSQLDVPDWQNGNAAWQLKKFSLADIYYVLPAGHGLELIVTVDDLSGDDMWFAYDTGSRKSRIRFIIP